MGVSIFFTAVFLSILGFFGQNIKILSIIGIGLGVLFFIITLKDSNHNKKFIQISLISLFTGPLITIVILFYSYQTNNSLVTLLTQNLIISVGFIGGILSYIKTRDIRYAPPSIIMTIIFFTWFIMVFYVILFALGS